MIYTIAEVNELIGLSKVSIYKKLKLKELKEHITKNKGITYIDEIGFNLIKYGIKEGLKDDLKDFKEENINTTSNNEIATDSEELSINKEVFKLLKDQLKEQNLQLKEKDLQLKELNERLKQEQDLHKNTQILFKQQQPQDILLLEEHFQDLDTKLINIKERMESKNVTERNAPEELKKGFFKRIFKK